jgi:hypothetical protein
LISIARKITAEGTEKTQRKQRKIIVSFSVSSVVFVFNFYRQENNRRERREDAKGAEKISAFFSACSVVFVFNFYRQENNRRERREDAEDEEGKLSFSSLFPLWFLYLISIARKLTTEDAGKTQSAKRKNSVFFSVSSVVFVFDFNRQEN